MVWDYLRAALDIVLTVETVLALFGGVVIGTVIGAIPGMTLTMGVALTLPFTFNMQPAVGILLLLGVYKGGVYGGSITAILIKTPGTPAASCTVLDGYPPPPSSLPSCLARCSRTTSASPCCCRTAA